MQKMYLSTKYTCPFLLKEQSNPIDGLKYNYIYKLNTKGKWRLIEITVDKQALMEEYGLIEKI